VSAVLSPAAPALACWCGNAQLQEYGGGYLLCPSCSTLVSVRRAAPDPGRVRDEAADLYGANYFFEHARALGHPDLAERARSDLSERCEHWLRALLGLRPPPATTLELGCASGAFVALLTGAGYAATGQELSPAIAALARQTFGVPVLAGPIEEQQLAHGSVDALILLDVLEHLHDPLRVLGAALPALRGDGLLLLQLPCFDPALSHAALLESGHPFRTMLLPDEHLYLYSRASVVQLLGRLGLAHQIFLTPIFSAHDMFLAAARQAIHPVAEDAWRSALRASREGRIVEALTDACAAARGRLELSQRLDQVEGDRARRLELILAQQKDLERLHADLERLRADGAAVRQDAVQARAELAAAAAAADTAQRELAHTRAELEGAQRRAAQVPTWIRALFWRPDRALDQDPRP